MEKETQNGVIFLVLAAMLVSIFIPIIDYVRWENRKEFCNKQANFIPTLTETSDNNVIWFDNQVEKETVKTLKDKLDYTRKQNSVTNKELNRLTQILGCYFDN